MNPRYPRVAARAGHRCEYGRAPEAIFNLPFEVEHIVPTVRGGADPESNWALSGRACNLHKSETTGLDWMKRDSDRQGGCGNGGKCSSGRMPTAIWSSASCRLVLVLVLVLEFLAGGG